MGFKEEYNKWLLGDFDENTKAELKSITDEKEIEDRFYKELSFGTGGLRGIIGAGTNRMNVYTVGKATQGLANFINSRTDKGSVVIAFDSRIMSTEFAKDSASVLAANGIKAYLFSSLRPTPELSFAVRELKATAGIVITASHNPPQYNGYKVYWSDGGQIVPPYDKLIIGEVNAVKDYSQIKRMPFEKAISRGLIEIIDSEIDDKYISEIKKLCLSPDKIKQFADDIKIVYTPLNGTGYVPVTRVLSELGFKKVWVVEEQKSPDGNFPTLKYPNPEDPAAFTYALKLAKQVDADIILATDPDADRLGVYAKDSSSGEYMPFTGNMSGLLIAEYILSLKKERGLLPENGDGALVTTIVSSDMAKEIAKEYNLTFIEVLTGFKYIGEQIKLFEEAKAKNGGKADKRKYAYEYEFGFEESYGCLVGTHARDKDAVTATAILCETAAYYRGFGLTLWDQMQNIYEKYGYFKEGLATKTLTGAEGAGHITYIMKCIRENYPKNIGDFKVSAVRDYKKGERYDFKNGQTSEIILPQSNVLYFELEGGGWCCVRPSGTEPKIKFYFGVIGKSDKEARICLDELKFGLLSLTNL